MQQQMYILCNSIYKRTICKQTKRRHNRRSKTTCKEGITELIIIAQDTTKYGVDLYGEGKLPELLEELSKIRGIKWLRFLYSYPEGITDELIETVANNKKIVKYFDIPIQHISNDVLKRMNRKTNKNKIEQLITKIRNKIPEVTLRTSLIVGFPGETKEQFNELLEFVEWAKFNKLGVFQYSKEDGTPAAKLPDQIHGNTKKSEVLIENISFDNKYFIGRTKQDAPDIDGLVYIKNNKKGQESEILNTYKMCTIKDVSNYDLIADFNNN